MAENPKQMRMTDCIHFAACRKHINMSRKFLNGIEIPAYCNEKCYFYKKGEQNNFYAARAAFYKSNEWQRIRLQVLNRDNFQCQDCHSDKNIDVHHVNYERFGGNELLEDLITLCRDCHEKRHGKKDNLKTEENTNGN